MLIGTGTRKRDQDTLIYSLADFFPANIQNIVTNKIKFRLIFYKHTDLTFNKIVFQKICKMFLMLQSSVSNSKLVLIGININVSSCAYNLHYSFKIFASHS